MTKRTTEQWEALLDEATPTSATGLVIPTDADERLRRNSRAAVAEVIRLRRALEAQRDRFRSHAKADSYLAKSSTVPLVPFYGDQARLLDRILNGDTDH